MSIPDYHPQLSEAATNWLLAVANPLDRMGHPSLSPTIREVAPVLHAAELHGVLPAALRALSRSSYGDAAAPHSGSNEQIQSFEKATAAARLRRVHQIGFELQLCHHGEKVLKALHTAGISTAIVKGPTFARRLYAEPAMRSFTDIDLLIPAQAREATSAILRGLGFRLRTEDYRSGKDYCEDKWMLTTDPLVGIEVHTNLVHNPSLRRAASIGLNDVIAAGNGDANDATALLFVAATHGAVSHQFDRIQHLVDVALAASGAAGAIDVERLHGVARRSRVLGAVHAALAVAGRAFGAAPCRRLSKALGPSALCWMAPTLITPSIVVAARSSQRSRSSWRRKVLRQAIRFEIG